MLSPQSRDNNEIENRATMDTILLKRKEIPPCSCHTNWLPWATTNAAAERLDSIWTPCGCVLTLI
jgi:hypothetical protein